MKENLMRWKLLHAVGITALAGLAASQAQAEVTATVSGYGTVGAVVTNKSDLEFRSSQSQAVGAGSHPDFGVDTRLGLQGVIRATPQVSFTGQILAQRRREDGTVGSNNDLNAGFEWAFAQYSPISNLDLRAGRVVLPVFMISDSRNVGYSQPWLRAPQEVYGAMPITTLDGVQALWRIPISSAILTIQPSYGHSSINIQRYEAGFGDVAFSERWTDVKSINVTLEWGDWLIRAGQVKSRSGVDTAGLFHATEPLSLKDKFTGVGLQYDDGKAVFMTEWAQRRQPDNPVAPWSSAPSLIPGLTNAQIWSLANLGGKPFSRNYAYYAAGGWHFGKWLPMLIYGCFNDQFADYHTVSLHASVRYDIATGVALKAQVGRIDARSAEAFVRPDPITSRRKVDVLSVAADFVF